MATDSQDEEISGVLGLASIRETDSITPLHDRQQKIAALPVGEEVKEMPTTEFKVFYLKKLKNQRNNLFVKIPERLLAHFHARLAIGVAERKINYYSVIL